jgi:hypothetical protein
MAKIDYAKSTDVPVAKDSKNKEVKSDSPVDLGTLVGWLQYAKDISRKKNWKYFVVDQFLKGNQNITANPTDNSITVSRAGDDISFPINKMYANFRAYRTFVLRNKPKVEFSPDKLSDDQAKVDARRKNAILNRDNRLNNFRKLNYDWVYLGVKYGLSYRQLGYDKTNHTSVRWTVDPWDMLCGSPTGSFEDCPYVIKPVRRTLEYWESKYPDVNVPADNMLAEDEYKQLAMQIEMLQQGMTPDNDKNTAIGYETWYRIFKPNKYGGLVNKCLFTKSGVVEFKETPYREYPFIAYKPEVPPNEIFPQSTMEQLIAPQRLENILNQQMVEYNYIVNRGRYEFSKDSGFEVINTIQGQLVRHAAGRTINALPIPPINPALQWQIGYADESRQLIGAQNDATLGKTPFAGASGALVEALQSGDANQLQELRDNFEDALAQEAQMILTMYDFFEGDGFVVEDEIEKGKTDQFFAIGNTAAKAKKWQPDLGEKVWVEDNGSYLDYFRIATSKNIHATLTSELGETKQARLNFLSKLVELGMPLPYLLKNLEFPDVDDIEQRIAEEFVVQQMQDQQAQQQQAGAVQGQPQNGAPPGLDVKAEQARIQQKLAQGGTAA